MTEFLVEFYVSSADPDGVARAEQRVHRAAVELTGDGTPVRFVRSIFVPADETCLFLFEADSIDTVRAAARRADITFEHVAETAPCTQLDQSIGGT